MAREEGFISQIVENGLDAIGRYYSIYRGVVTDIEDDMALDRLKVYVPELDIAEWALPRGQMGSHNCGFRSHPLPKIQDIVYVTFEDGNPSKPLWEWHGWGEMQMPDDFLDPDVCGLITPKGTKVLVNDRTGEVYIQAKSRIGILAEGDDGIAVSANKIYLNSKDQVIINGGIQGAVDIIALTERLNQLVMEIESLKASYNSHTHTTPSGPSSSPVTPYTKNISTFNKSQYEDTALLH